MMFYRTGAQVTKLEHHEPPSAQENAFKELIGEYQPRVEEHHLADVTYA
jgi:hypothetical protein